MLLRPPAQCNRTLVPLGALSALRHRTGQNRWEIVALDKRTTRGYRTIVTEQEGGAMGVSVSSPWLCLPQTVRVVQRYESDLRSVAA